LQDINNCYLCEPSFSS